MRRCTTAALLIALAAAPVTTPSSPILWAWERPEDLRFAGPDVTIAILAGTVRLTKAGVLARPRLQPALVSPSQQVIGVVHVEIEPRHHPVWSASQRVQTAAIVLDLLHNPRFSAAQIDFEVKASDRHILLDLLKDVREALGDRPLSMTALASWCDTETWIDIAPVDEIVPMLFRMGRTGDALKQRLASGGDFRQPSCRRSIGIATDSLPDSLPAGRRLWIFNPRSWTGNDFTLPRQEPRA